MSFRTRFHIEVDIREALTPEPSLHARWPWVTTGLAVMVAAAAVYGLLVGDAYRLVTELTRETWRAQDAVNLVVAPLLVWATWRAARGSLTAHVVSVGLLLWLAYAALHLAIAAPITPVFLLYVAIAGVAGFGVLDGLLRVDVGATTGAFRQAPALPAAWFLTVGGAGIAVLWLTDILAAWPGGVPAGAHLSELPNPTWVLDLAWVIPLSLGSAWLLRRRHPAGPVVAGALLVMLLALSAAMLAVTPFALAAGLWSEPDVAVQIVVFSGVFSLLAVLETALLVIGRRRMTHDHLRRRRGWWS